MAKHQLYIYMYKQSNALWYTVKANNYLWCESNIRANIPIYVAIIRATASGNAPNRLRSENEVDAYVYIYGGNFASF